MRPPAIIGLVLLVLGVIVMVRGGSFTTKKDVLKIGDAVKITADDEHSIPSWVGIASVVAGVVLIGAGARKRA
jgi:multidrug transporter EmrE-like cation transporter